MRGLPKFLGNFDFDSFRANGGGFYKGTWKNDLLDGEVVFINSEGKAEIRIYHEDELIHDDR